VLLVGAALLVRTLVNLTTHDLGFDDRQVLAVSVADGVSGRPAGQAGQIMRRLIDEAGRLPGVESVSLTPYAPMTPDEIGITVGVEGDPSSGTPHTFFTYAGPDYFRTMGLRLVEGRTFPAVPTPGAPAEAVVNRTLARRLFGDASPLGRSLRFVEGNRPPMTIIGVVADASYNTVREAQRAFMYLRMPFESLTTARSVLLVRSGDPQAAGLVRSVEDAVIGSGPGLRVTAARTLRSYVDESLGADRLIAGLAASFGLMALAIVAVGIFGVLATSVARRRREIGLRMALGAGAGDIVRSVAGPLLVLVAVGLMAGLAGATLATSVLSSLLFEVETVDLPSLLAAAAVLGLAAAAACYLPARRALQVDPAVVLRGD
jgi:putative ABC transport system permease protein